MGVMGAGGGSAFLTPPHHDHQFIIAFAARRRATLRRWPLGWAQSRVRPDNYFSVPPRGRAHSIRRLPVTAFAARLPVSRQTTLKPD